jgi:hypothetical protein
MPVACPLKGIRSQNPPDRGLVIPPVALSSHCEPFDCRSTTRRVPRLHGAISLPPVIASDSVAPSRTWCYSLRDCRVAGAPAREPRPVRRFLAGGTGAPAPLRSRNDTSTCVIPRPTVPGVARDTPVRLAPKCAFCATQHVTQNPEPQYSTKPSISLQSPARTPDHPTDYERLTTDNSPNFPHIYPETKASCTGRTTVWRLPDRLRRTTCTHIFRNGRPHHYPGGSRAQP